MGCRTSPYFVSNLKTGVYFDRQIESSTFSPRFNSGFSISVLMPVDENDRQLLGFQGLDGLELFSGVGREYGN
jgi:hypothetical protein